MKPPCGYRPEGIADIWLLDYDDFGGFEFDGDGNYDTCKISEIIRTGEYVPLGSSEGAKYESSSQNGVYTHTVEAFIEELSADIIAQLHLGTKRRYLVFFRTNTGKEFVYGYEAGAALNYNNQTADGIGSLLTFTAASVYPLFEFAELSVSCEWGDFINIWQQACVNAYSTAYSKAYNCNS